MAFRNLEREWDEVLIIDLLTDHERSKHKISESTRKLLTRTAFISQILLTEKNAPEVIDTLQTHGALFVDMNYEVGSHVIVSIDRLRDEIKQFIREVALDAFLKRILQDLHGHLRVFMNETSANPTHYQHLLPALRIRVGVIAGRLRDEFGCEIRGDLNRILSNILSNRSSRCLNCRNQTNEKFNAIKLHRSGVPNPRCIRRNLEELVL